VGASPADVEGSGARARGVLQWRPGQRVAPTSIDSPMAVYNAYEPLWKALRPETVRKVALENNERIFDQGRR
jgi:hypothetical protein